VAYVPLDATLDAPSPTPTRSSSPARRTRSTTCSRARRASTRRSAASGPIVGICGGYQLLGERITGADIEGTGSESTVEGVGVLPVETHFSPDKRVERVTRTVAGVGPLAGATGTAAGYEIHMGRSSPTGETARPLGPSAATGGALGTYLHGLFENGAVRDAFVSTVFEMADESRPTEPSRSAGDPDDTDPPTTAPPTSSPRMSTSRPQGSASWSDRAGRGAHGIA